MLCLVALLQLSADLRAQSIARGAQATNASPLDVEILSPADWAEITGRQVTLQVVVRAVAGATVRLHPIVNGQHLSENDRGLVVKSERAQGSAPPLLKELLHSPLRLPAKASSTRCHGMTWGADSVWLLCYGFLPPRLTMAMWIGRVSGSAFSEVHAWPPDVTMRVPPALDTP